MSDGPKIQRRPSNALIFPHPHSPARHSALQWNIPNTLTVLRLLVAPGFAVMFLHFHRPWADWFALTLFVGAAITDWFDGYLARLWKQESKFGTMFDPIADKAMVVIAIRVITGYNGMNLWLILPATIILFRAVFVSGLREFLGAKAVTRAAPADLMAVDGISATMAQSISDFFNACADGDPYTTARARVARRCNHRLSGSSN
jgi:CDP-diacylglycerol--glycerol-3-phosphate 3-phosphatidyltransferase